MRRAVLASVPLVLAGLSAVPAHADAAALRSVGGVPVHRCDLGAGRPTLCGSIQAPLDYTDARAGTITIAFGWVPATGSADGTVVTMEGGPGYPSTGTAPDFAAMLGGLLDHRNLLVVDARGTGRSTPIDCEPLQSLPSPSPDFTSALTACGRQLDHTFPRQGGGFVHASDLFTTANTARDVAGVIRALGVGPVDLYGDSYGTFFSQSFLSRYPHLLRSVVLDSAYEARDLDPWYRTTVTTARRAFVSVCAQAVACPDPKAAWQRISQLAAQLRQQPVSGSAVGTDDRRHKVTVGVEELVNIVNDAGYDSDPYRQLDAAARAYLDHHDATPLLRLWAQDVGYDYSDYVATPASYYSDGLYFAVACSDYPQLFDMRSSVPQRRAQLRASIAKLPANTFAPFTTREWIGMLPYTEAFTACLTWPKQTHPDDPPVPAGRPLDPGNVPVLVLNGALDSLTPAAGGAHIARQIGAAAQHYVAANNVHLVALDSSYACGPRLVQDFFADPAARLHTACLAQLPPIRAVPQFPATLAQVTPAHGSAPDRTARLAAVAVAAAGDAVHRYDYVDGNADLGLRGGRVHYDSAGDPTLSGVRWTSDSRVSGTVRATAHGWVGTVQVTAGGEPVSFDLGWDGGPTAHMFGAGARLTAPAP